MNADTCRRAQQGRKRGFVVFYGSRSLLVLVVSLGLAICIGGCNVDQLTSEFRDRREAFSSLPVGIDRGASRQEVVVAMGTPLVSQLTNVAGVQVETLSFADAHSKYEVTLISGRTWVKSATPKSINRSPRQGDKHVTTS